MLRFVHGTISSCRVPCLIRGAVLGLKFTPSSSSHVSLFSTLVNSSSTSSSQVNANVMRRKGDFPIRISALRAKKSIESISDNENVEKFEDQVKRREILSDRELIVDYLREMIEKQLYLRKPLSYVNLLELFIDPVQEGPLNDLITMIKKTDLVYTQRLVALLARTYLALDKNKELTDLVMHYQIEKPNFGPMLSYFIKHKNEEMVRHIMKTSKELDEHGLFLIREFFSLNSLVSSQNALAVLRKTKELNFKVSPAVFTKTIYAFAEEGDSIQVGALIKEMEEYGYKPNDTVYSNLMEAYLKNEKIEQALEIYGKMKKLGLIPKLVTVSNLIKHLRKNGDDRVLELIDEIKGSGLKLTLPIYGQFIAVYAHKNNKTLIEEIRQEMKKEGVKLNQFVYGQLLEFYGRRLEESEVISILAEMKSNEIEPNLRNYTTLMQLMAKLGRYEDMLGIVNQMEQKGIAPDTYVYVNLIEGAARAEKYEESFGWYQKLKKLDLDMISVAYVQIIDSISYSRKLERLDEILNDLKARFAIVPLDVHEALVECFARNEKLREALEMLYVMKKNGHMWTKKAIYSLLFSISAESIPKELVAELEQLRSTRAGETEFNAEWEKIPENFEQFLKKLFAKCNIEYLD